MARARERRLVLVVVRHFFATHLRALISMYFLLYQKMISEVISFSLISCIHVLIFRSFLFPLFVKEEEKKRTPVYICKILTRQWFSSSSNFLVCFFVSVYLYDFRSTSQWCNWFLVTSHFRPLSEYLQLLFRGEKLACFSCVNTQCYIILVMFVMSLLSKEFGGLWLIYLQN